MVVHTCSICLKEFNKKSTYINHIENKKRPCKPFVSNNSEIFQNIPKNSENINKSDENNCICIYCKKKFSTIFNLNKHIKYNCKVKKIDEEKKENIFNNLLEKEKLEKELLLKNFELLQKNFNCLQKNNENLQINVHNLQKNNYNLQKQNDLLLKGMKKLEDKFDKKIEKQNEKYDNQMKKIINKNCNNTNNYTQNNIIIPSDKLVEFGKEDLTKIDLKDLLNNIKSPRITGTSIFIEMLKLIHFNPKLPEFQNVYLTDKNREKYMTWNGDKWGLNTECLKKILTQFENFKLIYEEDIEEASKKGNYKNIVDKFIKYFDKCFFDEFDEYKENKINNEKFRQHVEELIKEFLYNNRNLPIENYENIKKDFCIEN